jgi:hypothetical protein
MSPVGAAFPIVGAASVAAIPADGHMIGSDYVCKLDLFRRSGTLASGGGRPSARSTLSLSNGLTARCARYTEASDGAVMIRMGWELRGSRLGSLIY